MRSRRRDLRHPLQALQRSATAEAFMRRLKTADPAYPIYEAYGAEHEERWSAAKALTMDEALAEIPEIERKYALECEEYSNVLFGISEELGATAKLEQEQLAKLADVGKLQAQLDSGALVAIEDGVKVTDASTVSKSIEDFDTQREKAVEVIMATKVPALEKRK